MVRNMVVAVVLSSAILFMTGCNNASSTGTSDNPGAPPATTAQGWKLISNLFASSIVSLNGTLFATGGYPGGVSISKDTGKTWTDDRRANGRDVTVCGNSIICVNERYFFLSTNMGSTWRKISSPDSLDRVRGVYANNNVITVATRTGIYRSTDHGATWMDMTIAQPDSLKEFEGIFGTGDNIIAIEWNDTLPVYISSDNGQNWARSTSCPGFMGIIDHQAQCYTHCQGYVFLGATETLLKSSDNGANWQKTSLSLIPPGPGRTVVLSYNNDLFAQTNSTGLLISHDLGTTWTPVVDAPYATSITVCGANLVAASPSGIWRAALK